MYIIKFDSNAHGWVKHKERNRLYLKYQFIHFSELIGAIGYLYMNYIYESLGIAWDPDKENICFRNRAKFLYEIEPVEDSDYDYVIKISY